MGRASDAVTIGTYEVKPATYLPYDPRFPEVAARVAKLIRARMPEARIEHIGSTAVPGCGGKGNVDLLLLYPPGHLDAARETLDGLGFQRWTGRGAFPEERPVRVGTIQHDGAIFRLHVHVVATASAEVDEQIRFREALRADPALVKAYDARKRDVIAEGITYGPDYADAKGSFIREVVGRPPAPS
ncbi:MAG TPA: GrpB family protein [Thermomicrobiales bacterium]|nr:GrpB family protein [Thermomicrobiales bacterium]